MARLRTNETPAEQRERISRQAASIRANNDRRVLERLTQTDEGRQLLTAYANG